MGSLAQARILGGAGSVLILLSIVPQAGMVLGLVGFILVLLAVKYISDEMADRSIFNNMLIAVVLTIAGIVVGTIFVFAGLFTFFGELIVNPSARAFIGPRVFSFLATLFAALIIIWIFYIVSAIFLRKSYRTIASELNIGMFDTVALLYLIGAVLSIVLVGFIIIYVAEILQVAAFSSISEKAVQPVPVQTA